MKNKSKELDVDFIGGQGPLTKEEERRISEFIKAQKARRARQRSMVTRFRNRREDGGVSVKDFSKMQRGTPNRK